MSLWDKVKNVFKKRRFEAATASPRLYPVNFSNGNVNADLEMDWIALTMRARNLAKNNEFVSGYLANIDRNVIGAEGFSLQSRASTEFLRDTIKQHWNDYRRALSRPETGLRDLPSLRYVAKSVRSLLGAKCCAFREWRFTLRNNRLQ